MAKVPPQFVQMRRSNASRKAALQGAAVTAAHQPAYAMAQGPVQAPSQGRTVKVSAHKRTIGVKPTNAY